ncbi:hypothetical protein [Arenibaculum pallidiluteum]|uniref:hypothetical protein n=1 Tax=Arenibaculum pallidiluteum TaxID=2812559 RepID=UPI001A973EEB|nr:hypothetical protein [Arenibaculum pallidiluteum]
MVRTLISVTALLAVIAIGPAQAQAPDPGSLNRGFHKDRLGGQIQELDRRSLGGNLDSTGRRDLMERRTERGALDRPSVSPQPGPYRDPVDGSVLLETPSNPALRR